MVAPSGVLSTGWIVRMRSVLITKMSGDAMGRKYLHTLVFDWLASSSLVSIKMSYVFIFCRTRRYDPNKRIFNQETELVHDLEPIQVSVVEARNSKASTQWPERMTVVR